MKKNSRSVDTTTQIDISSISIPTQLEKLGLRVSQDTSDSKVKVYDLVPEIGIVRGFGANIQDRENLISVLEFRNLLRNDGIYLLFKQMSVIYVGISQKLKSRLTSHRYARTWDRVIAFYSIREMLNPNIAGYVERKLYDILSQRGFKLEQSPPEECFLSQQDEIVMRQTIQEIDRVLSLLDMATPVIDTRQVATPETMSNGTSVKKGQDKREESIEINTALGKQGIEVELTSRKAHAHGIYSQLGLEVKAGSEGTAQTAPHMQSNKFYKNTIEKLQQEKVIEIVDEKVRFLQSYIFSSPTAAAQILTASNRPGPLVWRRISDQKTIKDLEDQLGF